MSTFSGLDLNMGNLFRLSNAQTRSISAENPTGEKGKGAMDDADPNGPARELGQGWKCTPCRYVEPGTVMTLQVVSHTPLPKPSSTHS